MMINFYVGSFSGLKIAEVHRRKKDFLRKSLILACGMDM